MRLSRLLPLAALVAAACDSSDPGRSLPLAPSLTAGIEGAGSYLYTSTNSASGNAILAYALAADGSLTPAGSFATGGAGTGAGLGNQSAVTLDAASRVLVVVNAGSNEISSFIVRSNGTLRLRSTVASGGVQPISVTIHGSLVYVLNAGGSGNIAGFTLNEGMLQPLAGSSLPLSSAAAGAAQIAFSPNGRYLVVTEKMTNSLDVYAVAPNGSPSGPTVVASHGATPFGFSFRGPILVVSEAFGGAADASAVSSYEFHRNGSLGLISGSVPTTETAACWIAITGDGRFAYTTNTGSGSISGYSLVNGALALLTPGGKTADLGAGTAPIDLAVSGAFLYSLNSGNESITGFSIGAAGSLSAVPGGVSGLPDGATGLAVR